MSLQKTLPRIAARVLHNTHVGQSFMKEKFELIETAYGRARVEEDFENWCEEVKELNPRYPLTEYIKVVDQRMGQKFAEPDQDLKDPRITEVSTLAYELTGVLPAVRSVARLLSVYSPEEIIGAAREFVGTLDTREMKSGMRTFFAEGGASAVILARRQRGTK